MDHLSFIGNSEIEAIDQLYKKYTDEPSSVDESWRNFFKGYDFARQYYTENNGNQHLDKEFRVLSFIDSFRKRGHLFTKTNPVRTRRLYFPTMDLENYQLGEKDLDTVFHAGHRNRAWQCNVEGYKGGHGRNVLPVDWSRVHVYPES